MINTRTSKPFEEGESFAGYLCFIKDVVNDQKHVLFDFMILIGSNVTVMLRSWPFEITGFSIRDMSNRRVSLFRLRSSSIIFRDILQTKHFSFRRFGGIF